MLGIPAEENLKMQVPAAFVAPILPSGENASNQPKSCSPCKAPLCCGSAFWLLGVRIAICATKQDPRRFNSPPNIVGLFQFFALPLQLCASHPSLPHWLRWQSRFGATPSDLEYSTYSVRHSFSNPSPLRFHHHLNHLALACSSGGQFSDCLDSRDRPHDRVRSFQSQTSRAGKSGFSLGLRISSFEIFCYTSSSRQDASVNHRRFPSPAACGCCRGPFNHHFNKHYDPYQDAHPSACRRHRRV
ncbi:uncharacterized protein P884DRAFT_316969 [Thermothelomyces heterothallicus CBS 202.75]|uniref:uncharacterized protein n=1 Tax=Thermothelomyces heterothallicus CBS 202.75 TaxID=1149848 RepID=UPI0037443CBD